MSTLLGILAAFVLIAVNGYFVATEFALIRVRPISIEQLAARGVRNAHVAREQLLRLELSLAAAQIGITLAGLVLGWIGEPALEHALQPLFTWASGAVADDIATGLAIIISLLFITALHTIFGEVLPKSIGITHSEKTLLFAARPFALFARLFYPLIRALHWIERTLMQALRLHTPIEETLVHSPKELEALVVQSSRHDVFNEQEEVLSQYHAGLHEKIAEQVMLPFRSVSASIPLSQLLRAMQSKHLQTVSVIDASGRSIGTVTLNDVQEEPGSISTV